MGLRACGAGQGQPQQPCLQPLAEAARRLQVHPCHRRRVVGQVATARSQRLQHGAQPAAGRGGAFLQPGQRRGQALFGFGEIAAQRIVGQGAVGAEARQRLAQARGRVASPFRGRDEVRAQLARRLRLVQQRRAEARARR